MAYKCYILGLFVALCPVFNPIVATTSLVRESEAAEQAAEVVREQVVTHAVRLARLQEESRRKNEAAAVELAQKAAERRKVAVETKKYQESVRNAITSVIEASRS